MKLGTLDKFSQVILSIESQSSEKNKQFEICKCKAILKDGSNLKILEWYENMKLVIQNPTPVGLFLSAGEKI